MARFLLCVLERRARPDAETYASQSVPSPAGSNAAGAGRNREARANSPPSVGDVLAKGSSPFLSFVARSFWGGSREPRLANPDEREAVLCNTFQLVIGIGVEGEAFESRGGGVLLPPCLSLLSHTRRRRRRAPRSSQPPALPNHCGLYTSRRGEAAKLVVACRPVQRLHHHSIVLLVRRQALLVVAPVVVAAVVVVAAATALLLLPVPPALFRSSRLVLVQERRPYHQLGPSLRHGLDRPHVPHAHGPFGAAHRQQVRRVGAAKGRRKDGAQVGPLSGDGRDGRGAGAAARTLPRNVPQLDRLVGRGGREQAWGGRAEGEGAGGLVVRREAPEGLGSCVVVLVVVLFRRVSGVYFLMRANASRKQKKMSPRYLTPPGLSRKKKGAGKLIAWSGLGLRSRISHRAASVEKWPRRVRPPTLG